MALCGTKWPALWETQDQAKPGRARLSQPLIRETIQKLLKLRVVVTLLSGVQHTFHLVNIYGAPLWTRGSSKACYVSISEDGQKSLP